MSKKFKILMSSITMCFALAMMVFGIFAASQVTYTVTGQVTYTVTDVFCSVDTVVKYSASFNEIINDLGEEDEDIAETLTEDIDTALTTTLSGVENMSYTTGLGPNYDLPTTKTLPTFTFKDNNVVFTAYRIIITVTLPVQSGNVRIVPTCSVATAAPGANAKLWFYLYYNTSMAGNAGFACQSETTETINCYVFLQDKTKNITTNESAFTINVAISKVAQ